MRTREFSNLIEKYRRGELSPQEREALDSFLESFQTSPGEWVENEMGNKRVVEERILARILSTIKQEEIHRTKAMFFTPSLLTRAAAIAFFFILSAGILYVSGIFSRRVAPAVWSEAMTSPGEKSILFLPDSTQVTLNADSKLRFPDRFDGAERGVYLEGEGYFAVRHNNDQPFVVHTGSLSTTVLGTKFDVSAYPESKTIAVSLLEGRVRVTRNEKGKEDKTVVLKPEEHLIYDKENGVSSFGRFDSLEAVGWKDGIYKFENEPLSAALPRLERAFGARLIIADQKVLQQKITVTFENNSQLTVLGVIKNLTGLEYSTVVGKDNKQEVRFVRKAK